MEGSKQQDSLSILPHHCVSYTSLPCILQVTVPDFLEASTSPPPRRSKLLSLCLPRNVAWTSPLQGSLNSYPAAMVSFGPYAFSIGPTTSTETHVHFSTLNVTRRKILQTKNLLLRSPPRTTTTTRCLHYLLHLLPIPPPPWMTL